MIDIVIVNWNSGRQLGNCINSITEFANQCIYTIVVIDNGSIDGSEVFANKLPNVLLIHANENLGFGKACNLGAAHACGEYLLFLNPDAALHANTLDRSLAFMQNPTNERVGICGVQLLDETGHVARSCARFPHPVGFLAHSLGLVQLFPRLGHAMSDWAHDQTKDVDHVIGAFYLIRRSLYDQLGGFDERFFVYLEDLDLSYRAHLAGWRSVYLADVQAFHAGGGTSNQVKAHRLFYSLRSRLLYAFKHFSLLGAVAVLLTTLFVEPLSRSVLALLRCSWAGMKETWAAYGMLWCWMPQWVFRGVTR